MTTIGLRPAAILMSHLPPVGWADLATRGDIAQVRGEIAEIGSCTAVLLYLDM